MNTLIGIVGWIGTGLLLAAYALVSLQKLRGDSVAFQLMNFFGAFFLLINALHHRAPPLAAIEAAWMFIAAIALLRRSWPKPPPSPSESDAPSTPIPSSSP